MKAKLVHSVLLAVLLAPCTVRATTYDSPAGVFASPILPRVGEAMAPWLVGENPVSFYAENASLELPDAYSAQVKDASPEGELAAEPSSAMPLLAGLLIVALWVFLKGRHRT